MLSVSLHLAAEAMDSSISYKDVMLVQVGTWRDSLVRLSLHNRVFGVESREVLAARSQSTSFESMSCSS